MTAPAGSSRDRTGQNGGAGSRRQSPPSPNERRVLKTAVARFRAPIASRSLGQIASTFLPFFALLATMYASLAVSYWLTLAAAIPAAGLLVRIFIIQHDCGHGSFFRSRRANDLVGRLCSLVTLTPYAHWRRQHAGHHAVWNNLDRRESGADIYSTCLTLIEYRALPPLSRWQYRVARHPAVSLLLLPPLVFLALYRVPFDTPRSWRRERASVYLTNLAIVGTVAVAGSALGFAALAAVYLPIITMAAIIGVWLFSVQHRFEHVYWGRQETWTWETAALQGSSYLKLPRVLQWFTGNIGLHHVHHLNPLVPNYRLQDAHEAISGLTTVPVITLGQALRASRFALWDEDQGCMVRFPKGDPGPPGHQAGSLGTAVGLPADSPGCAKRALLLK